jgi:outer membrane protein
MLPPPCAAIPATWLIDAVAVPDPAAPAAVLRCPRPAVVRAGRRQNPGVQAGISAGATSGAYAHYDVKPLVVPSIAWQGERFFASPGSLGMYLYKGEGLRLSAAVTPYTLRFKTDDVNDPQLRRLHSRQMSAMAGINGEYSADWGIVEASVMREVTGHGGGMESRLHYSYPIQAGRFTWVPKVGVVHSSARLLDYYYGISDEEALRSGLAAYNPGSATSPSLQIAVSTPWARSGARPAWSPTSGSAMQ